MRKIKIVADSACDLFRLKYADFSCAPMKVITNEREFVDTEALDVNELVTYLASYRGKSQSSCPNTGDWLDAFGDADDIFCVTITSGLSGSYNAACIAQQIYEQEHDGKRVFVIDTLSAGPEMTLIIEKLEELIQNQVPFEDICEQITAYMQSTGLVFMLRSLKNFANNGRISPLIARVVGIAGICIVGKASETGTLESLHKCRGEKAALKTLVDTIEAEGGKPGKVSIGHCHNQAAALQLEQLVLSRFPDAAVEIHELQGLCSFYAEKGGVLVGFEKAEPQAQQ